MDFEQTAISRLREGAELSERYYQKPLIVLYSGGKDSEVVLDPYNRRRTADRISYPKCF